jgi:hypothetical protein
MSGIGGSGGGRLAQRRLAVVALLTLAGIFAVVASAASAKHTKPLKLNVDGWELYTNPNPGSVTVGPAGGTLSYCKSLGNRGLDVSYTWRNLAAPYTLLAELTTPSGRVVKRKLRFAASGEHNKGSDFFGYPANGVSSAPAGSYKFIVKSSGHTARSQAKVVAKNC